MFHVSNFSLERKSDFHFFASSLGVMRKINTTTLDFGFENWLQKTVLIASFTFNE